MSKRYLYSPWRLEYLQTDKPDACLLCGFAESARDAENLIVHRESNSFVMLNRYPYNNGHIMLVPNLHVSRLGELPDTVLVELTRLMCLSETVLQRVYSCDGINIGINLGQAAGAGIADHLHIHLVPRWHGDSNFMTVAAGERVIPEAFEITWQRLRQEFENIAGSGL